MHIDASCPLSRTHPRGGHNETVDHFSVTFFHFFGRRLSFTSSCEMLIEIDLASGPTERLMTNEGSPAICRSRHFFLCFSFEGKAPKVGSQNRSSKTKMHPSTDSPTKKGNRNRKTTVAGTFRVTTRWRVNRNCSDNGFWFSFLFFAVPMPSCPGQRSLIARL